MGKGNYSKDSYYGLLPWGKLWFSGAFSRMRRVCCYRRCQLFP